MTARELRKKDAIQEFEERGRSLIIDDFTTENGLLVVKLFDIRKDKICGKILTNFYLKALILPFERISTTVHADWPEYVARIAKEIDVKGNEKLHIHFSQKISEEFRNLVS
jgi:hypothetical protein